MGLNVWIRRKKERKVFWHCVHNVNILEGNHSLVWMFYNLNDPKFLDIWYKGLQVYLCTRIFSIFLWLKNGRTTLSIYIPALREWIQHYLCTLFTSRVKSFITSSYVMPTTQMLTSNTHLKMKQKHKTRIKNAWVTTIK